ncbi:MAG: hypothetical protein H6698_04230 [Myxococcales bacterium]|nr:hypothetical protein [Myxococcales bacterium]MCB9533509.1 hypothetical protein [Myxococcales bacterium]
MNTRIALFLPLAASLTLACGDEGGDDSDTTTDVATDAVSDVADVAEDSPPDVTDADVVDDSAPDTTDVEAGVDADAEPDPDTVDTSDVDDTADAPVDGSGDVEDVEPDVAPDTGIACGTPVACEAPYVCIAEVCRLPISETAWAESDFDIVEPEELTRIFAFLKSLTPDVKFAVIELGTGESVVPGVIGTADVVDDTVLPLQVWWQDVAARDTVVFRPLDGEGGTLGGDSWQTDRFPYSLRARAEVSFPGLDPITAEFGLDALDVALTLTPDTETALSATGTIEGYVTRAETEDRVLAARDGIPGFAGLFCLSPSYDPGADWNLSDVLDCNEAELDVDSDADGILDAYRIRFDARLVAAALVAP